MELLWAKRGLCSCEKKQYLVAGRSATVGDRPLDDGIMAVPIPADHRRTIDADMKAFIKRHKESDQPTKK
jgi:hypothetical protein